MVNTFQILFFYVFINISGKRGTLPTEKWFAGLVIATKKKEKKRDGFKLNAKYLRYIFLIIMEILKSCYWTCVKSNLRGEIYGFRRHYLFDFIQVKFKIFLMEFTLLHCIFGVVYWSIFGLIWRGRISNGLVL